MKKLILTTLIGLLIGFTGCNKDDGEAGSSLKLKLDGEVIDLSDTNFYLVTSGEYDAIDNESEDATHSYGGVYITDSDWSDENSIGTFEIFLYVEFPIDQINGDFELMSFQEFIQWPFTFTSETAVAHVEVIYDYSSTETKTTYKWAGFDPSEPSADDLFSILEDEDESIRFQFKAIGDLWDYDSSMESPWTQVSSEAKLSFDVEGMLIDIEQSQTGRVDTSPSLRKKQVDLRN